MTEKRSDLKETYDRYKHLDDCLSDPIWCADGPAIYSVAGELWRAIKNEVEGRK